MIRTSTRYLRVARSFAVNCLVRDMSFRADFLMRMVTDLMWYVMLVFFYHIIFTRMTSEIAGWTYDRMLVLLGTVYAGNKLFQGFFLGNCNELSEQIRTGNLDFVLLKPINPQFMVSLRYIDYSSLINVPVGLAMVVYGAVRLGIDFSPIVWAEYLLLLGAGVVILYALMFMLASTSVWMVRNEGLTMLYFSTTSFARYPAEIYRLRWLSVILTYVIPMVVVANSPAKVLFGDLQAWAAGYAVAAAIVLLWLSNRFFVLALRSYRSASS